MIRLATGVVGAVLVLAACTSSSDDIGLDRSESLTTQAPTSVDEVSTAPSSTSATPAGPVRFGIVRPRSIDPAAMSPAEVGEILVADLLYDTLTVVDDSGPRPGLAAFAPNDDRSVWRFTIRPGATFASGRAIVADDIVYSIDRVRRSGATLAALRLDAITAVNVADHRSVDIVLAQPSAVLPELLSAPEYPIVDRAAIEGAVAGGDQTPNASGDFVVSFDPEGDLALQRRQGSGVEAIEIRFFDDASSAVDAMLAGEVDWASVPPERLGDADAAGVLRVHPFQGTLSLGLNLDDPALASAALRGALARSVDRSALVAGVFGPAARPLTAIVPSGVPGADTRACDGRCDHDLATARILADQAAASGPVPTLRILVEDTDTNRAVGGLLVRQFGEIGITAEVVPVGAETYGQLVVAGDPQLFLVGDLGLARTADSYLRPPFLSSSPDNVTRLRDESVDALLAAAAAEPDAAERTRRWAAAEAAILERAPVIPLVQFQIVAAVAPRIAALTLRADGTLDLATAIPTS